MRNGGAALIIDYGHAHSGLGETLQAVSGHTFADPLRAPGEADLTAHVDFEAIQQVRRASVRASTVRSGSAICSSASASRSARRH